MYKEHVVCVCVQWQRHFASHPRGLQDMAEQETRVVISHPAFTVALPELKLTADTESV
jgi:hypothetical protein